MCGRCPSFPPMSENKNPLVSLGELSKPATVLIEKVSEAVGGICKPWQMVRVAKAEAEVERIRAESEIQISDLHGENRDTSRFIVRSASRKCDSVTAASPKPQAASSNR